MKGHRATSVRTAALVYVWLQFTAPPRIAQKSRSHVLPLSRPCARTAGEGSGKAGGADAYDCHCCPALHREPMITKLQGNENDVKRLRKIQRDSVAVVMAY